MATPINDRIAKVMAKKEIKRDIDKVLETFVCLYDGKIHRDEKGLFTYPHTEWIKENPYFEYH